METLNKHALLTVLFFYCTSSVAMEEDHSAHQMPADNEHTSLMLGEGIRQLLTAEMKAIQNGMQAIIPALAAGQWHELHVIGEQMHDSYIMKKNLSPEQVHELHEKLPAAFIKLDHSFHHTAGQMAAAAKKHDAQLVSFYYYKMIDTCVECHTDYATHKFPSLSLGKHHEEH